MFPILFSHLPLPSLLTALLLSPCPYASTWTMADRGTEGTHGLGWFRGTENHVASWPWHPSCRGKAGGTAKNQCMHRDGFFVLSHIFI